MGTAYTPGLTVSPFTTIQKSRRLPLKGEVVVSEGQEVTPETVVARTLIPGILRTVKVADLLGVDAEEVRGALLVKEGDTVAPGQVIARTQSFFGLFKSDCKCPIGGKVELISPVTGHVGVREAPDPIEVKAYVEGRVARVVTGEGVVVEAHGALIQGIFGVGGERQAPLRVVVAGPNEPITESALREEHRGQIVVGGSNISGGALRRAAEIGVTGVVVGAIVDRDLIDFLGYDIGVAITGHENIPLTLVITEGFGTIRMADRTFRLLQALEGKRASINGATQIRAGVIRPEVIVPLAEPLAGLLGDGAGQELDLGTPIRIIREPYFGASATVTALPPELQEIPSGADVRVLEAALDSGERVVVPRANVEIIATS
jgi:hypothetical protein